jgi:hypothetical protein
MSVTTDGLAGNSPLIQTTITSASGYNAIQLNDNLGRGWQVSVPGSGNSNAAILGGMYLYDVHNSNPFFVVDPVNDTVVLRPLNNVGLIISTANTNSSELILQNLSTGGHAFHLSSSGSSAFPGNFVLWDDQFDGGVGGEPLSVDGTGGGAVKTVSTGVFGWSVSSTISVNAMDTAMQRVSPGMVSIINMPSMTWGSLGVDNLKLGTDAPQCNGSWVSTFMRTTDGKPGWCDGTTLHTISLAN